MKTRSIFLVVIAGILILVFTGCTGNTADPLNGTAWVLTSLDGANLVEGTTITLIFEDGNAGGSSGCNSYGGTYQLDGNKIQISEVVATLMACTEPEGAMEQEGTFLGDLGKAETFELSGGQLLINTSDGRTLTFSPQ
jgi:heat shock protein HslJ